ncbi:MAG: type I DNA topoisomerase [Elusimicrobia bacterium]|nr:type I DNA topoisomerase [Elusimicrobiota bacterium]
MAKTLLIVESPTKEKKIGSFLGKDFVVKSCMGHVRDLPQKELGVDEKDFTPRYEIIEKKAKSLAALKSLAKDVSRVILATDYDREGEAIAWHLVEILKPPKTKVARVVFHEITKEAIHEALKSPRSLDMDLISAQQARRVLDRLVGYKLSPLLWKKVRRGLSAGRVQSVAVRLITERELEIKAFGAEDYWTIHALFEKGGQAFSAELIEYENRDIWVVETHQLFAQTYRIQKTSFKSAQQAKSAVESLAGRPFEVEKAEGAERRRSAAPPFITSTMTQAASQALSFSAQRTMQVAQGLYENGFITYMRTDSVHVAEAAQVQARAYVKKLYGAQFLPAAAPIYKTKVKGAQEAHEAIRPTSVERTPETLTDKLDQGQAALYDLIWRRFLASQMTDALYHVMTVDIRAAGSGPSALFRATGRRLVFEGFLKLYRDAMESEEEGALLPEVKAKETLSLAKDPKAIDAKAHQTSPPPRYNEASLIRALEEHGIGRPSTYAPIIGTILERRYVYLQERRFYPTETGALVSELLKKHFPEVVDLSFTAQMEGDLDHVAEGKRVWRDVVKAFYTPFAKDLSKAEAKMERVKIEPKDSGKKCALCGSRMLIKESRFGQYLACENNPKTCTGKLALDAQGVPIVPEATEEKCPKCAKPMLKKRGFRGRFYLACQDYPKCKTSFSLDKQGNKIIRPPAEPTDFKCDRCQNQLLKRWGPRGPFLACSKFPKCRFTKSLPKEEGGQGEKVEKTK